MQILSQSTNTNLEFSPYARTHKKQPTLHSYHQYESLLKFITSFIFDVRMILSDLKQTIFELVGIECSGSRLMNLVGESRGSQRISQSNKMNQTKKSHRASFQYKRASERRYNDNYCEIEFMMKNCHSTKDDLLKITSLIKGYQQGMDNEGTCNSCFQQNIASLSNTKQTLINSISHPEQIFGNVKQQNQFQPQSSQSLSERPSVPILSSCKSQVDYDQVGFLTFREITDSQTYLKHIENTPKKQNHTTQQWTNWKQAQHNNSENDLQNYSSMKKQYNKESIDDLWQDSLLMIELMRNELDRNDQSARTM